MQVWVCKKSYEDVKMDVVDGEGILKDDALFSYVFGGVDFGLRWNWFLFKAPYIRWNFDMCISPIYERYMSKKSIEIVERVSI